MSDLNLAIKASALDGKFLSIAQQVNRQLGSVNNAAAMSDFWSNLS